MPNDCVAPGCDYGRSFQGKRSLFSFPKEAEMRSRWLRSIPRVNFVPSQFSRVCEVHFEERFVVREDRAVRKDGTVITSKRDKPKLTKDAYPTLFPALFAVLDVKGSNVDVPKYASKISSMTRSGPAERKLRNDIKDRQLEGEKTRHGVSFSLLIS